MSSKNSAKLPSEVSPYLNRFDKFSSYVAKMASKAWFFIICLIIVVLWVPSIFVIKNIDTWQLIINTTTTIVTFLMVALLQNTQTRDTTAMHRKLNAIADGLADLMDATQQELEDDTNAIKLQRDIKELKAAVGIEEIESS